jgi:hypothetical protein
MRGRKPELTGDPQRGDRRAVRRNQTDRRKSGDLALGRYAMLIRRRTAPGRRARLNIVKPFMRSALTINS